MHCSQFTLNCVFCGLFSLPFTKAVMLSCLTLPSVYFPLRREPLGFAFPALTDPDMRRCERCRGAAGAIVWPPFGRNSAVFFFFPSSFFNQEHLGSTEAKQARQTRAAFPQKSAHSKLPHFIK